MIQELLQNANAYSYGPYDYELILRHYDNKFHITVLNFANEENATTLLKIVDEIKKSDNLNELIINYMKSDENIWDNHLNLIIMSLNTKLTIWITRLFKHNSQLNIKNLLIFMDFFDG